MNVSIIGVSSFEGEKLIKLLEKSNLNIEAIHFMDCKRLDDSFILYKGENYRVNDVSEEILNDVDLIFICKLDLNIKEKISSYLNNYTIVLDKSDLDITEDNVSVIIPDINSHSIEKNKIMVSPRSSVMRMALPLYYLRELSEIVRVDALIIKRASCENIKNKEEYIEEEFEKEFKKIFNYKHLELNPVYLKIPGIEYSIESLVIECSDILPIVEVKRTLSNSKKFKIVDNFYECSFDNNPGFKGKYLTQVKIDVNNPRIINLLIMSDYLYDGAISNAVKIAERIFKS